MTTSERRSVYIHNLTTETPMCANCAHYYPHYTEKRFPLHSGHCVYPRAKLRNAYDTCEHFQNKNAPPSAANT